VIAELLSVEEGERGGEGFEREVLSCGGRVVEVEGWGEILI
jgi:hypothetical protein